MDEGGMVVRSAAQRRETQFRCIERQDYYSLSLSVSLSHLILSCTWTDARTCLLHLRLKSHSFAVRRQVFGPTSRQPAPCVKQPGGEGGGAAVYQ